MGELTSIFDNLVRLETELWNAVEARLRAELGVPLGSFEALRIIASREGCRVNDIADALAITVGGSSKLVDRVEAAELVRRRANPQDRRSSVLELTPAGKRRLDKASRVVDDELERRIRVPLAAEDLAHLAATLITLRTAGRNLDA
jgi:DNA-binding MarR family transcriptional regulator